MVKVFITAMARTPKAYEGGLLKKYEEQDLLAKVIEEIDKTIDINRVDELISGTSRQTSTPSNSARYSLLLANGPEELAAYTVNMMSASSAQAIRSGFHKIKSQQVKNVLVGGSESSSNSPAEIINGRYKFDKDTKIIYKPMSEMQEIVGFKKDNKDKHSELVEEISKNFDNSKELNLVSLTAKVKKEVIDVNKDDINKEGNFGFGDGAVIFHLSDSEKNSIAELVDVKAISTQGFALEEQIKNFLDKNKVKANAINKIAFTELNYSNTEAQINELTKLGYKREDLFNNILDFSTSNIFTPLVPGAESGIKLFNIINNLDKGSYGLIVANSEDNQGVLLLVKRSNND